MDGIVHRAVLVLNQNYEPLNVCSAGRAVVLVDQGKAEVLEPVEGWSLHSVTRIIPIPSVIRLIYFISRPHFQAKLTRRELFLRDRHTCQYCGKPGKELTIDHVVPRHRGGRHVWENLVSACKACNHRKAGRTPDEARMRLLIEPGPPQTSSYFIVFPYIGSRDEWHKFIPLRELEKLLV